MREFEIEYDREDMIRGLRTEELQHRELKGFTSLINLKPKPYGLIPFTEITQPFASINFDYPFPQIFKLGSQVLYATRTQLYTVDTTTWDKTPIFVAGRTINGGGHSILSGGHWHVLDFLNSWMLINGSSVVFKSQYTIDESIGDLNVVVSNDITVTTGIEHRGRAVLGGFNSADFWSADWEAFWTTWANAQTTGLNYSVSDAPGTNFVMWSNVGEGLLWLWYKDLAMTGIVLEGDGNLNTESGFGSSRPKILELFQRGDMGWMPMPWDGTVLNILELGKDLVVYGTNGVTGMTSVIDPIPTYGIIPILDDIGLASRSAVAKGKGFHLFVDTSGEIRMIENGFKETRIGYKEFIAPMLTEDGAKEIVVSSDEYNKEFYICNGQKTYMLTETGLCRVNQLITSVIYHGTESKAITKILGV